MYTVSRIGTCSCSARSHEGALDLEARVVAGERGAAEGVRAEEALRDPPVRLAGERHPVALEVARCPARHPRVDGLHRARIGQQVALLERVGGVLLPRVLRIHGRERRVDPARGERRVRVGLGPLADGEHVDACLRELDRRAETGAAGPDDEDPAASRCSAWCTVMSDLAGQRRPRHHRRGRSAAYRAAAGWRSQSSKRVSPSCAPSPGTRLRSVSCVPK